MSSPYLNNLIIIGCILTYTSVILLGLNSGLTSEHNFPYICAVSKIHLNLEFIFSSFHIFCFGSISTFHFSIFSLISKKKKKTKFLFALFAHSNHQIIVIMIDFDPIILFSFLALYSSHFTVVISNYGRLSKKKRI